MSQAAPANMQNSHGEVFSFPDSLFPHNGFTSNHIFMMALVAEKAKAKYPVKCLEVGSWCGYSAIIWAQALSEFGDEQSMLTCVDSWAPYLNASDKATHEVCRIMDAAAATGKAHQTFLHNMRAVQNLLNVEINSIRGLTKNTLPLLQEEVFDIVYLDAAHSYEAVHCDLPMCMRLLKEGGILCGDDLEVQLHELDDTVKGAARKYGATDSCIVDMPTGRLFHPGVTLAVGELLGQVSRGGKSLWAMRKKGDAFERFDLPVSVPFQPIYLNQEDQDGRFYTIVKDFAQGKIKWGY